MTVTFSGPMFQSRSDKWRISTTGKDGGHYNIYGTRSPAAALAMLHDWFDKPGSINEMNFVLFSTSGVHGMYTTIEEVERDVRKHGPHGCAKSQDDRARTDGAFDCGHDGHLREVTFLLVQPRIVGMTYGNVECRTLDDVKFLRRLRRESRRVFAKIGGGK